MDSAGPMKKKDIFEKTFEHCGVGLAHVSPHGELIRVNSILSSFLGYSKQTLVKTPFQSITDPAHLQEDLYLLHQVLRGEIDTYSIEKKYLHAKGHSVWAKLTVTLVRDEKGEPDYFISVVEDIDDKKRIEFELFKAEALFSKIVAAFSSHTFVWVADPDLTRLHYINEGYRNIYGRNEYELHAKPDGFLAYVHDDDRLVVEQAYQAKPLKTWDIQYRIKNSRGEIRYIHDRGMPLFDESEEQILVVGTADDVSHEKEQQQALLEAISKLEYLSKIDPLTGISNRREMFIQLDREIQRMNRGQHPSTLVFVDLDNFKGINDTFGHKAGDKALVEFSNIMKSTLRETDRFARLGGDEFVLLLFGSSDAETEIFFKRLDSVSFEIKFDEEMSLSTEISKSSEAPESKEADETNTSTSNNTSNSSTALSFSLGWQTWHPEIVTAQNWVDAADEAMYKQKRQHHENAGAQKAG
ncbi:diguanylate cyclase [Alteromonas sp. 1_MG-2023]|uniref:sensor domain-containing diguanylate cyclase n=1 Tax=Alteromonas sp. 1_MG-2023 TaxID=3062669 RepID=UPI0026E1995F|nr:sensor domain-containing diguanylate cyclase [Alteromonas sp. 1_MG-2023]MDO6567444.1 diguanylate cyclase [Alteromonas sp. 1_MG-2023]